MDVHHLANILEELGVEGFSITSQQINRWSVVKYPMVHEMSCGFRCKNTSHGYRLDHFGEPIGVDKEVLVTSLDSDEVSK